MPYYNEAPGDEGFAAAVASDPNKSMASRVGARISEKDALDELAARDARTPALSSPTSLIPQTSSNDDAEKAALDKLQQRDATPSQEAALGPSASFSERFAAAPELAPGAMAKQMIAQKGFGRAIVPFYQNQLQRLVQEHPYATTTIATGVNAPVFAGAGAVGIRVLPFLMRNLGNIGLSGLGIEQLYEHAPQLLKLIRP